MQEHYGEQNGRQRFQIAADSRRLNRQPTDTRKVKVTANSCIDQAQKQDPRPVFSRDLQCDPLANTNDDGNRQKADRQLQGGIFHTGNPGRLFYELLLGDYTEIEEWIAEGRVDCGFLRLPTYPEFDTIFLEQDNLMAIIPEDHPLADCERFPLAKLCEEPFMLLEHGAKAEVSEVFERNHLTPHVRFTTWDDYAIMSMVESGLGVSILPQLILKRVPYRILAKELDVPAYRNIGLAMKNKETISIAVKRFMEYLDYREPCARNFGLCKD